MLLRHFSSFIPIFLLCFAGFNAGENPNSDLELHFTRVGRDRRGRYVKNKVEVIKRNVEFDDWVARGYFENKVNVTGFGYLEVETNGNADSALQAYHAGFLEGFLTADLIYARWFNTLNVLCRDQPTDCELVENFVKRNSKWLSRRLKRLSADPYWYQVKLFYLQVNGVLDGYNSKTKHEKLSWDDILAMNMLLEFGDILQMAKGAKSRKFDNDHCSALIKVMPDNSDIYFGHNTWYDYMEMLRILKKYNLNYAKSQSDAALIPGRQMSFSSYPAAVQSIDDYYLIASSGLAVMETTNEVFNLTLFKDAHPFGKVFEAVRSMVANRLAVDGETWFKTFVQFNSGTYNNQWMVLDYNKIEARFKFGHGPDVLWVGEQLPGYYVFEDVTRILFSNGYWASYNIPYFREVYEKSGYEEAVNANGTWYSYTEAPRARIFARDQETVKDMDSFMTLLRSNNFEHEPFARCNCTPPYSAAGAIAARRDLNPVDGQNEQVCKPYGAIDAKITNRSMFRGYAFQAVAGPTRGTNGELPVFKWSESRFGKDAHHLLQPDVFDFAPVNVEWKLGGISRGLDEKNEYMVVGSGVDYSGLQGVFAGDDNNIPID